MKRTNKIQRKGAANDAGRRTKAGNLRASADGNRAAKMLHLQADAQFYKPIKKPVTLRLDADVLAWFRIQGRGYQTRINRALRGLMLEGRKAGLKS